MMNTSAIRDFSAVPSIGEDSLEESKVTKEWRWAKQHVGLSTIFAALVVLIAIGTPIYYQSAMNTAAAKGLEVQETNSKRFEDNDKALLDAVSRIAMDMKTISNSVEQTQKDVQALRTSSDQQLVEVRTQVTSNLMWTGKLENRIARLEALREAEQIRDSKK